ncbi:hypothetical protein [Pseudomonas panipatensis]|uniref:Uncharacterized protein n=1 Tax=Pseudomonas panipatensis TaxID=428992 RepID=A0A1G8EB81_9PSED|nr:hypothetical protein [Pseudomonas panipatensis]SDH67168.1 hypothetical protein SAMN05216272_102446 [Pseudomonas panipatensis]SMP37658.1 hypothetical protein SAMN06295951_10144 [Pseudomonas panipatensis]
MHILVRPSANTKSQRWQVCLDQMAVDFRSEKEARLYVSTLEARLRAPHLLPPQSPR